MYWTKLKTFFLSIWKDPVWSKVIATGILIAIPTIWARLTNHTWEEIFEFVKAVLSFPLPLYVFLSAIALVFIIKFLINFLKRKRHPVWDEQIGNYSFKELVGILSTETFEARTRGMEWSGQSAPDGSLLFLFEMYQPYLSTGIDFDTHMNIGDGGYLYGVLAPKLMGYGLVEAYEKPLNDLPDQTETSYRLSETGYKFYAGLQKIAISEKAKELKNEKKKSAGPQNKSTK